GDGLLRGDGHRRRHAGSRLARRPDPPPGRSAGGGPVPPGAGPDRGRRSLGPPRLADRARHTRREAGTARLSLSPHTAADGRRTPPRPEQTLPLSVNSKRTVTERVRYVMCLD